MSTLAKKTKSEIAYLGPVGSFASIVAKKRCPDGDLRPLDSVKEVFDYLDENEDGRGIVPIESSSGGFIPNTVDGLIENAKNLSIEEVLSIDVKLALLGKKGSNGSSIQTVYSHFAPFRLCRDYLQKHYPGAERIECNSTSAAAKSAAEVNDAVALAPRASAEIYGLDILDFPVKQSVDNVTQFFVLSRGPRSKIGDKTSIVMALPNKPGSLVKFLNPFSEAKINIS